ncbi:oligosaccharide flippase family protein [Candidatus Woesebacteria bacterium]|nr:oligosaccharide flippase family protein [Candidatus Woesebacteria bacterium]
MGYTKNTISGFSWQTVLRIASMGVVLIKTMFIARILSPNDFGLFALIAIALGIAEATTETGVNLTIIQSKSSIKYFIDTAWVIAIIRGFFIGILMVIMGILMSKFYNESSLTILIALAALVPVIKGFINPSIILFHKNLEFFKDSLFRFSIVVFEAGATVLFAYLFRSVSALILGLLAAGVFEVFLSFVIFSDKPTFNYMSNRAKVIFSNAKGLSISAALSYINQNVDDFILGKTIGLHSLGLYHNAYSLGHKTNHDFAKSAHHSFLPVFTKIVDDTVRIKKAFIKSFSVTTILIVGLSLPLLIAPEFFISIILGSQWLSLTPYLYLFVLAGILQSIAILFYSLFFAQKKYSVINSHLAFTVIVLIALLLVLPQRFGIAGAGIALVTSRFVTLPILFLRAYSTLFKGDTK